MKAIVLTFSLCLMLCFGTSLTGYTETSAYAPSATQPTDKAATYQFETKSYRNRKIIVNYPQLINLDDTENQNSINAIIEKNALKDIDYLTSEAGYITYELDYKVTCSCCGLISIRYTGYSYVDGAAHPNNFLFTTNIDVKNSKVLQLKDLVDINESFVDVFKNGVYSSMFHDMTPAYRAMLKENLNDLDAAGWIINLKNADMEGSNNDLAVYSYLTEDSLVIAVSIPHYMGDFFEVAITRNNLDQYKSDNAIWDEIQHG